MSTIIYQNYCALEIANLTSVGNYGVALQIEDFKDASSTTPLSSVPLQFVINVQSITCTSFPTIVSPTPPAGLTLQTDKNGSLQISARANSYHRYADSNVISIISATEQKDLLCVLLILFCPSVRPSVCKRFTFSFSSAEPLDQFQ